MPAKPVRVGIAGLGRSGWNIHALGIEAHPRFALAAVTDPEADRMGEAATRFGCRTYDRYEALLADPDVELVVVATPSHTHAAMTCAALTAGKHVLVEKPMALDVGEADAMLRCARENGRIVTVYQIRRLEPDFVKVREILASGVLGPVHEVRLATFSYDRRRDWQTLRRFGGGQLNNNGSHLVDQALLLAGGEWRDLFADLRQVACAGDAEDHVKLVFRGAGGMVVDVELAVSAHSLPRWLIMGKHGTLVGDERTLQCKYYDPSAVPPVTAAEGPVAGRKYGSGESLPWVTESIEVEPADTRAQFYDRLYGSLREGAPLLVPPEQSRELVALLAACHAQADAAKPS